MENQGEVITPSGDDDRPYKTKQYLTEKLERAEHVIENIRKEALKMGDDLDSVYNSIDAVKNSKSLNSLSDGKYFYSVIVGRYLYVSTCF